MRTILQENPNAPAWSLPMLAPALHFPDEILIGFLRLYGNLVLTVREAGRINGVAAPARIVRLFLLFQTSGVPITARAMIFIRND